jgi:hypothetical protein
MRREKLLPSSLLGQIFAILFKARAMLATWDIRSEKAA